MKPNRQHASNARLLALLVITLVLFAIFIVVPQVLGFVPLDSTASPIVARSELALMTHSQRLDHVALTAIVDSLFPLAYGYLFIGIAQRFWGRLAPFLCAAVAMLVVADLLENAVQIVALLRLADMLGAKVFLTPLKFTLFFGGWVMAVLTIPLGIVRKAKQAAAEAGPRAAL